MNKNKFIGKRIKKRRENRKTKEKNRRKKEGKRHLQYNSTILLHYEKECISLTVFAIYFAAHKSCGVGTPFVLDS